MSKRLLISPKILVEEVQSVPRGMPSDERTGPLFSASDTTTTDLIVGGGVRRDRDADGMTDTDS